MSRLRHHHPHRCRRLVRPLRLYGLTINFYAERSSGSLLAAEVEVERVALADGVEQGA